MADPEGSLDKAWRHVLEGEERVDQQRRLIEQLSMEGHEEMLAEAKKLLAMLEGILGQMYQHLLYEEQKAKAALL